LNPPNPPALERRGGAVIRQGAVQPITPVVIAGQRLAFVSGQVPMRDGKPAAPDIAGQTHAVIDQIESLLQAAGSGLDRVAKITVWLVDAGDYPAFNAAYAERFGEHPPARSTVISGLLAPVKIEMEAIAVL